MKKVVLIAGLTLLLALPAAAATKCTMIRDGIGTFTEVDDLSDLFGTYAQAEAHAGAAKSAKASAMTKGEVSLSFAGKGEGVDIGVAFGKFTIEKVD